MAEFQEQQAPDFIGKLNFQSDKVTRSLISKGDLYAIIDPVTSGFQTMQGVDAIAVDVPIYDARGRNKKLDINGFELIQHPFPSEIDFTKDDTIVEDYYPMISEFLKNQLGAYKVFTFDHHVRSTDATSAYQISNGQKLGGVAQTVHCDYSLLGGPFRRDGLGKAPYQNDSFKSVYGENPLIPPEELAELKSRRFAIINLWRSLAAPDVPLVDFPLAVCDALTTQPSDFGAIEFRYVDRQYETYLGFHSSAQRWYYFSEMLREDALLLKTYDSQGAIAGEYVDEKGGRYPYFLVDQPSVPATFCLHSAVQDPRLPEDYPKRYSIETRSLVFY